jgi:hypothetical protein
MGENVQRLHPELWQQKNWLLYHYNTPSCTSFFTRELLTKNDMTLASTYFSVSPIEDKTERPPLDTIEVIEAESQAVLNTHTEHNF